MEINYDEYAKVFKAISDPKRLQILALLSGGEMCACKLLEQFNITQPTLSHDMKLLCDAGLVSARKDGKWCYYSLNKAKMSQVREVLYTITECENSVSTKDYCN